MQEKTKIKDSMRTGSGADEVYVPTLSWFEIADRFLADIVKCRKSFKNIQSDSNRDEISSPEIPASPSQNLPPSRIVEEHVATTSSPAPNSLAPASPSHGLFMNPQTKNIKTKKRANVDRIEKSIQQLQTIKDQVLYNKDSEDEFSHFGKNIASQLRQLPIMDALDLESEILELVKRKRKSFLEREHSPASTCGSSYTIEIPEDVLHGVMSQNDTSYNALDQAIRSIGGYDHLAEE